MRHVRSILRPNAYLCATHPTLVRHISGYPAAGSTRAHCRCRHQVRAVHVSAVIALHRRWPMQTLRLSRGRALARQTRKDIATAEDATFVRTLRRATVTTTPPARRLHARMQRGGGIRVPRPVTEAVATTEGKARRVAAGAVGRAGRAQRIGTANLVAVVATVAYETLATHGRGRARGLYQVTSRGAPRRRKHLTHGNLARTAPAIAVAGATRVTTRQTNRPT